MDSNYDSGGLPGQPHWTEEPKPGVAQASVRVCKDCGAQDYSVSFMQSSSVKQMMDAEGVCFTCGFWRVELTKPHETVIGGRTYAVGNRPQGSPHNGMAGRRFDIEYFDGRRVTTYDLWSGGEIPERHRAAIPDTARFLGGAGFVKVGDGGAWNASRADPSARSLSAGGEA